MLAIFMRRPVDRQIQQRSDAVCRTYNSVSAWKYLRYVCQNLKGDDGALVQITECEQVISFFQEPSLMLPEEPRDPNSIYFPGACYQTYTVAPPGIRKGNRWC